MHNFVLFMAIMNCSLGLLGALAVSYPRDRNVFVDWRRKVTLLSAPHFLLLRDQFVQVLFWRRVKKMPASTAVPLVERGSVEDEVQRQGGSDGEEGQHGEQ
jgi:hypothetical protein